MDTDSHPILSNGIVINQPKGFHIGDNVWVGSRCTILKGAAIPAGCVLAAGSILSKRLSCNNAVYASAKVLREKIHWSGEMIEDYEINNLTNE